MSILKKYLELHIRNEQLLAAAGGKYIMHRGPRRQQVARAVPHFKSRRRRSR